MDNLLKHEALDRVHVVSELIASSLLDHLYFHSDGKAQEMATKLSDAAGELYQYLGSLDDGDATLDKVNEEQFDNLAKLITSIKAAGGCVVVTRKPNTSSGKSQGVLLLPDSLYSSAIKELTDYLTLLRKPTFDRLISL